MTLVDGVPTSRKVTPSTYGGFSSSKKDFENRTTGYSDTIGHAVAYKDSSRGRDKDGNLIYSDSNPRNYSPEKSHETGGSKWGQAVRNHQLEGHTRRKKGEYLEWNPYANTHEQVKIGQYVPSQKISMRIINLQESLAVFNQHLPITSSDTKAVWQTHVVDTSKKPKPSILDENTPLSGEAFSLGPLFLARSSEKLVMQSNIEFEIGKSVTLENGDIGVILSKKPHLDGFQYEYHAYYQAFHLPVAVYMSMGGVYDKLLAEYDALDQGYRDRFSPITESLHQLDTQLQALLKLSGERKSEALRFVSEALKSSSASRQKDAKEILEFVTREVKSIRKSYEELELLVLNHAVNRLDTIDALKPAFIQLIQELHHQDGMTHERLEEEIYRGLAGVTHDFKKQDAKLFTAFEQKAHALLISIKSLMGVLQPPKQYKNLQYHALVLEVISKICLVRSSIMQTIPSVISDSLLQLNEEQLVQLHTIITERLRLFRSAKHLRAMADFNLGDMVSFEYNGQKILGTITKLNQKSVSVVTLDGKPWKVSPQLLAKVQRSQ